jgi:OOP family OmpA-OmpF porin
VSTSGPSQLRFYPVQVDFDQLETASADQVRVKALDTRWTLPAADIKLLGDVGKQLLQRHPCFQAFARDAGVAGVPTGQAADCDQFIDVQIAQHSPPPPAAALPPPPPPAPVSEKVTFAATALFEFDQAALKPEAMATLDELVGKVAGVNLEVIITVGHTDSSGTDEYNQRLSKARAEAVKAYLVSKGIEKNRIYTESKGAKQPIASNQTAQGRAQNRRVEIEIVGTRRRGN